MDSVVSGPWLMRYTRYGSEAAAEPGLSVMLTAMSAPGGGCRPGEACQASTGAEGMWVTLRT